MSEDALRALLTHVAEFGDGGLRDFALRALQTWDEVGPNESPDERRRRLTRVRMARLREGRRADDVTQDVTLRASPSVTERHRASPDPRARASDPRSLDLLGSSSPPEPLSQDLNRPLEGECDARSVTSVTLGDARRGTRVPPSDASLEQLEAFARAWRIPMVHPEWSRFLDHWRAQPGAKGRKADWGATWRNWVRRAPELTRKGPALVNGKHVAPREEAPRPVEPFAGLLSTGKRRP